MSCFFLDIDSIHLHVSLILSSIRLSTGNIIANLSFRLFSRHAYPETAYVTAGPAGTIGPITVSALPSLLQIRAFVFLGHA